MTARPLLFVRPTAFTGPPPRPAATAAPNALTWHMAPHFLTDTTCYCINVTSRPVVRAV